MRKPKARRKTPEPLLSGEIRLSGRDFGPLEVLMRRAVITVGKRCALAGLALAGRRLTTRDSAVESTGLDLLLNELAGRADSLLHRPTDLRLHSDRVVTADVLEEGTIGLGEVVRIGGQANHRLLTGREHGTPELELLLGVGIRIDEILDRAIDRSRVLVHAAHQLRALIIHCYLNVLLRFGARPHARRRTGQSPTRLPRRVPSLPAFPGEHKKIAKSGESRTHSEGCF